MPRPGPRPYECVRRAWHSDRHQPIRGSIIQQLFRLVYEVHGSATKKNKEWQEKLPIVVFKAEEIMYSKANSEAEYMNVDTMWDRVNDAINTIIRRDESTETGEPLPPCVEVRTSRSQRHSNPRNYLGPRTQELVTTPPRVLGEPNKEQCPPISPIRSGNPLNYSRSTTAVNAIFPVSKPNNHITENVIFASSCSYPFQYESVPPGPSCDQLTPKENTGQSYLGSVYPLYYGDQITNSLVHEKANSNNIFVGRPVAELGKNGTFQNFLPYPTLNIPSKRVAQEDIGNTSKKLVGKKCDLSLRLGGFSEHGMNKEGNQIRESEEAALSGSRKRGQFCDFLSQQNNEFCFFPGRSSTDTFQSRLVNRFSEVEGQNLNVAVPKRKAPFCDYAVDGHSSRQPGFSNQFVG